MGNLSLQGAHATVFQVEDKIEAIIEKLEVWHHRLNSKRDTFLEAFLNLKDFLYFNEEKFTEEDTMLFTQNLLNVKQRFRKYLFVSKQKITELYNCSIGVCEHDGLTSKEQ
ncbi:hypothetical protein TNIN_411431 [Trichonephila inaurata madagascariensis]|uniref:Uncharacterized protein n=1 Tax=Trichonephila inaurata madagascariensis TaxID=2747483 RepID=A0A8X6I4R4_9ARAC|nr:hypothetical protein TNIN_411431 [Trichonephila inaurata madagascariensis]